METETPPAETQATAETPTQTQNITNTGSPQTATSNPGASDASPFQQSANADALKQNKTLQVVPTGNAVTGTTHKSGSSATLIIFIVVSSIVLLMIASTVFKWVMKQPEKPKAAAGEAKKEKEVDKKPKYEVIRPQVKKKKLPRSKRHK